MSVEALTEAIACAALALGAGHEEPAAAIGSVIDDVVGLYLGHVHWPSRLTSVGMPVELTLSIDAAGRAGLRYHVDAADQRLLLPDSWGRYLALAEELTGADAADLRRLMITTIDPTPNTSRTGSPVFHSLGYEGDGRRRGSLYFLLGDMSRAAFDRRFAREMALIDADLRASGGRRPDRYHCAGYDFYAGQIERTKLYAWLRFDGRARRLRDLIGQRPDTAPGEALVDHLSALRGGAPPECSVGVQSAVSGRPLRSGQRVIFNCRGLGLDRASSFRDAAAFIAEEIGVDLSALEVVLRVFSAYEIPLLPSWLSLGAAGPGVSANLYFVPVLEQALAPEAEDSAWEPARVLDEMLTSALRYLLEGRAGDGSWRDELGGESDEMVTASVVAALAAVPEAQGALRPSGAWLRRRLEERDLGAEATALAVLALGRLGLEPPAVALEALDIEGPPERIALALAARLSVGHCDDRHLESAIQALSAAEQWEGGWPGGADSLRVNVRVVEALAAAAAAAPPAARAKITELLSRARYCFSERPVAAEPTRIGPWLRGWLLTGHDPGAPSVLRALAQLSIQQRPDGQWLAAPLLRPGRDRVCFDPRCLLAASAIVEALVSLRPRLLRDERR